MYIVLFLYCACLSMTKMGFGRLLHRNSTVARRVTNVTSEHYGDP